MKVNEQPDPIRSMAIVVASLDQAPVPSNAPALAERDLVAPLVKVASEARLMQPPKPPRRRDLIRPMQELSLQVLGSRKSISRGAHRAPSAQRMIGRRYDENLHSDFVAALLDPRLLGHQARVLFARLFELGGGGSLDPTAIGFQVAYRETRLDALDPALEGTYLGARRLDVLARTARGVMVVENKVLARESQAQTTDYHRVLEERYGGKRALAFVMLSPEGRPGRDPAFRGVGYGQLFEVLCELDAADATPQGEVLLSTYLSALSEIFIEPERLAIERTRSRLKGAGYDV